MLTRKTYRGHTAAAIVAAAVAKPSWSNGGNLIAAMPDGDICFAVVHPNEDNGYDQQIILLNCMSISHPEVGFGCGVRCMDIDDDELKSLEELEERMWDDLNATESR